MTDIFTYPLDGRVWQVVYNGAPEGVDGLFYVWYSGRNTWAADASKMSKKPIVRAKNRTLAIEEYCVWKWGCKP